MTVPVAQSVWAVVAYSFGLMAMPPSSSPRPVMKPSVTRNSGGIRLCSKEYLTNNATPMNSARPPIQANNFTPMKRSQFTDHGSRSEAAGIDHSSTGSAAEAAADSASIKGGGTGGSVMAGLGG